MWLLVRPGDTTKKMNQIVAFQVALTASMMEEGIAVVAVIVGATVKKISQDAYMAPYQ